MKIPLGIEGDYIETKKTSLFFDVKGIFHPKDRKISFLRFIPNENGDRIKDGIKYKKIYDLEERYNLVRDKFPQYRFFSPEYDMELQCVKNEDIKRIYSPREYLKSLKKIDTLTKIEQLSMELCQLFSNEGKIPEDQIGITGSPMIGLNLIDSDIDLIIYGTKCSKDFQYQLRELFNKNNHLRMYNLEEYKTHYEWRVGGSDISFDQFLKTEKRKLHQGKFHNRDFFIRYIKSPSDWKGDYYQYQFKNLGRISLIAEILDVEDSIFTPCSYKINCLQIIKKQNGSIKNQDKIHEVVSFRGRFCEQAKQGEKFLIDGKLEKVLYKDGEHYRIILTDQKLDKMLLIS